MQVRICDRCGSEVTEHLDRLMVPEMEIGDIRGRVKKTGIHILFTADPDLCTGCALVLAREGIEAATPAWRQSR